jgi:hypothetical protein
MLGTLHDLMAGGAMLTPIQERGEAYYKQQLHGRRELTLGPKDIYGQQQRWPAGMTQAISTTSGLAPVD